MKRAAVLDLGTNTFNLIIAEFTVNSLFNILVNKKIPVKLGEGRINDGEIIPAALLRASAALDTYMEIINSYKVTTLKAFGTSAFRTAKNGREFLCQVKSIFNLDIEIISGDREAELIYLGVRQTLSCDEEKFVILDIGGGSNELIIADMHRIYWKKSYNLGVARLLARFQPSDPINGLEIKKIKEYFSHELADLFEALREHKIKIFVGASGAFETFVTMIDKIEVEDTESAIKNISTPLSIEKFNVLFEQLIYSTHAERLQMKGLEPMRVEMIVLAALFVKFMLENHTFESLIQSNFALKEGAMYALISKNI